jgi:hypothetical protein
MVTLLTSLPWSVMLLFFCLPRFTRISVLLPMLCFIMKVSSFAWFLWLSEHIRKVSPYRCFPPCSLRHYYYHLVVPQASFLVVNLSVFKTNRHLDFILSLFWNVTRRYWSLDTEDGNGKFPRKSVNNYEPRKPKT